MVTASPSSDWVERYQQYLAQAAANAARVGELYGEIVDRVAHGELSQQAFEARSPAFVQAHAATYASELAEVSVRFLTGVVASATTYTHELVDRVVPGIPSPPLIRAPVPEAADWVTWLQRFVEFAEQHNRARADMVRALADRTASGEVGAADGPTPLANARDDELPDSIQSLLCLYFDLLSGLDDVTSRFAVRFLSAILGEDRRDDFVLRLRGPIGTSATVRLAVKNTQPADTAVRCVLTDLRRDDGVGPAFEPQAVVSPERFELAPSEERALALTVQVDEGTFEPGLRYVGTLHVLSPQDTLLSAAVHVEPLAPDGVA